jgi:hypothetical protein
VRGIPNLTERTPAVNGFGVPLDKILELHKQAWARLDAAKTEALEKWLELDEARGKRKPRHVIRRLRDEAKELTELALS